MNRTPASEVGGKSVTVGAQLRSQPILRWAIAQLRILSWVAYLKNIEHISPT